MTTGRDFLDDNIKIFIMTDRNIFFLFAHKTRPPAKVPGACLLIK